MTIKNLLYLLTALLLLQSCKKDPPFSTTPAISFERIWPDTARAYTDSITVSIRYEDGDGDLGENSPYAKNLFLIDQRNQLEYAYRIGEIASSGDPAIRGTLQVVLPYATLIGGDDPETLSFRVYLVDRAGNVSNKVSTDAVTVIKN